MTRIHAYGNQCQFITKLCRSSEKGTYHLDIADISGAELDDCVVLASPRRMSDPAQLQTVARWLLAHFLGRCWLGVDLLRLLDYEMWPHRLREVSACGQLQLMTERDRDCRVSASSILMTFHDWAARRGASVRRLLAQKAAIKLKHGLALAARSGRLHFSPRAGTQGQR